MASSRTWFIYVFLVTFFILAVHFQFNFNHENPHKLFYSHVTFYLITNLFCLVIYLDGTHVHQWFIYVIFALAIPLCVHYVLHYYGRNYWKMHLFLFVDIQLLVFLIWTAIPTSTKFPWFVVLVIAGSIALGIHYKFRGVEPPRPAGKDLQQEEKGENQPDPTISNQPADPPVSRNSLDQVSLN